MGQKPALPVERIENRILLIRGHKVLIDSDLAALYGVSTKRFNEQVRRNAARFPEDFMFRLSAEKWDILRSQFATLKTRSRRAPQVPAARLHRAVVTARRPPRYGSLRPTMFHVTVLVGKVAD